jgi:soluble lytic murein transglycosylase
MGLMQVIPSVAKEQQSKTGIRISHFEDLYKPEINLPIGAALLSDLSKKYRGQFLLIAAAYNANEKAIHSWLKTRLNDDPLEFIEDIPYDETRAYIKLVLRNFVFYTRLGSSRPTTGLSGVVFTRSTEL